MKRERYAEAELSAASALLELAQGDGAGPYVFEVKKKHPFDVRRFQAETFCKGRHDCIPVIMELDPRTGGARVPEVIMTPKNISLGNFLSRARGTLKLDRNVQMLVSVAMDEHQLINFDMTMGEIFKRLGDADGFLYILYLPVI